MDDKTLVIYFDNGDKPIFRDCFNQSGIRCCSWLKNRIAYKIYKQCKDIRFIRKRIEDQWLFSYPENMDGLIILFDTKIPEHYIYKIREKNPNAKIIIWFWNVIDSEGRRRLIKGFDVWSYSLPDCGKYGLLYNSQFFFDSILERYRDDRNKAKMEGEQKFIFMGREKGRSDIILKIADEIKKCGWDCEINFLATGKSDRPKNKSIQFSPGFKYEEYMEKALKCQGILDAAFDENSGLSLRTMESIFFHKKLITTNSLVSEYEFFDENNIYVWDHSNLSLKEFLSRPYRPVPDSICETYLISSWLSRFKTYYRMK